MNELNVNYRKKDYTSSRVLSILEKNNVLILIGIVTISIIIFSFCIISTNVTAGKIPTREKTVTSVLIEKGDSLWSIASEFITEEYKDINDYIKEIKRSNGLSTDMIHEGSYIIVPYYVSKLN